MAITLHRATGVAVAAGVLAVSAMAQDSYYLNSGRSGRQEAELGEIAPDVGGFVPFARYLEDGHPFQSLAGGELVERLIHSITHPERLEAEFGATAIREPVVEMEWQGPRDVWWDSTPGYAQAWKFRVNGGPVLVIQRRMQRLPETVNILLWNRGRHDSDFGTRATRNDFHSDPRQFVYFDDPDDDFDYGAAPAWRGSPEAPNLRMDEQALARGDLVVWTTENVSADFWTAMLRTQDAERFVRTRFLQEYHGERDAPLQLGRSFVDGGSWGALVSGVISLLQPAVYSGAGDAFINDWGLHLPGVGQFDRLRGHRRAAAGVGAPSQSFSNRTLKDIFLLVDLLGIRQGRPTTPGLAAWDVAAFSINHRPAHEHRMLVHGASIGTEDPTVNWHWQREDARGPHARRPLLQIDYRKNLSHGINCGIAAGVNEIALSRGDEWQSMLAAAEARRQPVSNPPLAPTASTPFPHFAGDRIYPNPYDHTLARPPIRQPMGLRGLLSELPAHPDAEVPSLGQGVWPGHHDSLQALDVDGDGVDELVFGNHEGFVHVMGLEWRDGVPLLRNRWRSPAMGWGTWATAVARDGRLAAWIGDQRGQVHAFGGQAGAPMRTRTLRSPSEAGVKPRSIELLYHGDFDPRHAGGELLALTEMHDWLLMDEEGAVLQVLPRGLAALGPGICAVADIDPAGADELLIPALDGCLWKLRYDPRARGLELVRELEFQDHALYRVEVLEAGDDPRYLLFGRNDDLRLAGESPERLLLRSRSGRGDEEIGLAVSVQSPAMTWLPARSASRSLVVGSGNLVQRVEIGERLNVHRPHALDPEPSPELDASRRFRGSEICAVEWMRTGGAQGFVVVACGNGRLHLLDAQLEPAVWSDELFGDDPDVPAGAQPRGWHSNRTLAHVQSLALDPGKDGRYRILAAEFQQAFYEQEGERFRVCGLELPTGAAPDEDAWDEFCFEARSRTIVGSSAPITRCFEYADHDGDGQPEAYFLAEAGVVVVEDGVVRQFANRRSRDGRYSIDQANMWEFGGYVFEFVPHHDRHRYAGSYLPLSGFSIPEVEGLASNGGDDWWYPRVGSSRISGQIAALDQSVWVGINEGTSMVEAELLDPRTGRPALHVVTGTVGGHVYALRPGAAADRRDDRLPSQLSYSSPGLGWRVAGLDAGRLRPDDAQDTIVAGLWLDDGTHGDWLQRRRDKNRGGLVLLRPARGQRLEVVARLDGDELLGPRGGLASGVQGVKLDDVDGDGLLEIWCGDALGCVHLFRQVGDGFRCVYRSACLGAYAGIGDNLFPIKDASGRTVELVVAGAGYLSRFAVDAGVLGSSRARGDGGRRGASGTRLRR